MHPPSPAPPLWRLRNLALFLDLDGTLLDFAATPDAVTVPADLPQLLMDLAAQLGGAIAIVSGRPVGALESLLGATPVTLSGIHGAELKALGDPGDIAAPPFPAGLRDAIRPLAGRWPGLLIEDKGSAIALHVRRIPEAAAEVAAALQPLVAALAPAHEILPGAAVYEVKPRAFSKGTALRALMRRSPFAGRRPVFLGDDTTDEAGFAAACDLGGTAIAVGPRASPGAQWRLATPAAARRWLGHLAAQRLDEIAAP